MGEKFAANPVTGTGSMSVPIATSPGRSGFGPQLSLSYDSGAGNGPFGLGWNLSLPSITRKTKKGLPKYQDADESDVFILSGAEDLVPILTQTAGGQWVWRTFLPEQYTAPSIYRNQVVSSTHRRPVRLRRALDHQTDPKDTFWRSISRDNITTFYRKTAESRIVDPNDRSHAHFLSAPLPKLRRQGQRDRIRVSRRKLGWCSPVAGLPEKPNVVKPVGQSVSLIASVPPIVNPIEMPTGTRPIPRCSLNLRGCSKRSSIMASMTRSAFAPRTIHK
jgi:hypothetical protein